MTVEEAKQLAITLYWTATGKHDVDDQQWRVLLNVYNKKYWNEIARGSGSFFMLDTSDLVTDATGQYDYSGTLWNGDLTPAQFFNISTTGGWTLTNSSTAGSYYAPDGSNTAVQFSDGVSAGVHTASVSAGPAYGSFTGVGSFCIYAKAGNARFVYLGDGTNFVWFDLVSGTVSTSVGGAYTGTISPFPAPSFSIPIGVTSAPSPVLSPNGWYKCSISLTAPVTPVSAYVVGISTSAGTSSYTGANNSIFLWGPRKAFSDNMVHPFGVHKPTAVELKFLGRYINLDAEIPQDRYIYNIAFGQVQVLIPTAWTIMGEKIIMLPRTSGGQTFRISFVPRVSELIQDTQQLLNGAFLQFHPLVVYETVSSMLPSSADRPVMAPLGEFKQQFKEFLNSRQSQTGRKIRFVPYE